MKNTKLRPLTESSLLTAITVIIAMAGIYIPFIILFWTLPITIITAKHNLKYGIFSALIASILLCVFLTCYCHTTCPRFSASSFNFRFWL